MLKKRYLAGLFVLMLLVLSACGQTNNTTSTTKEKKTVSKPTPSAMILATTTSTQDTGLLDVLIPMFEKQYNVKVKTIAVGTGQALAMGTKGEADALLVHAPKSEQAVVAAGDAIDYKRVMYNDFVLVGPTSNPAAVSGSDIKAALKKIYNSKATFISRGDDSGTNKFELGIWTKLNIKPSGPNYVKTGSGMASTLLIASQKNGYTISDRGTWLSHTKNLPNLKIDVEGGKDLMNIYHVMEVNPAKHKNVNSKAAQEFVDFMVSPATQDVIAQFGIKKYGQPLFHKYTK